MIDHSVIDHLKEEMGAASAEILADLIETYEEESLRYVASLENALAAQDADALRRTAHGLKSPSALLGAVELAAICHELELLARRGLDEEAPDLVDRIRSETYQVLVELKALKV